LSWGREAAQRVADEQGRLRDVFDGCRRGLVLKVTVAKIIERAEVGRLAAYDVLRFVGRCSSSLLTNREELAWLRSAQRKRSTDWKFKFIVSIRPCTLGEVGGWTD